ncbi:MAG: tetratricopeptide repeat protein, partial [Magnetococcales bacterium]|nr:tetratricopeptide repeat protein [Magnetococcales bacterium]
MNRSQRRQKQKKSKKNRNKKDVLNNKYKKIQITLQQAISSHKAGKLNDAILKYKKVVEFQPDNTIALSNLSFALQMQGKFDEAILSCQAAISIDPDYVDAHFNYGNILKCQGKVDEAIASYSKAISIKPDYIEAQYNLGVALHGQGKLDAAVVAYKKVASLNPNFADLHNSIGSILQEQNKLKEAALSYQHAISINPDYIQAHSNLGYVLTNLEKYEQGIKSIQKAISIKPNFAEAHNNLGYAMEKQDRLDEAAACYLQALTIKPDYVEAICNLGVVYYKQDRLDDAFDRLKQVIYLKPGYGLACNNLGNIAKSRGDFQQAIDFYQQAITANDDYANAYNNISLVQLLIGDFNNGWKNYNWRWNNDQYDVGRFLIHKNKLWQGEELTGKRLLVWAEQGVGENIIFSSIIPDLLKRGGDVVLECNERLVKLFSRSFPTLSIIPHPEKLIIGEHDSEYDYIVPFGDICQWLRPNISSFSNQAYHLVADKELKQTYRNRYLKETKNLLVGISWQSKSVLYKNKSMTLFDLLPLLKIPGVTFVNLQYGDTDKERAEFTKKSGIDIIDDTTIDQNGDLDNFAAQVAAMDVVVTISNTAAHMAGALGVPTLLMLGEIPIWYWMLQRSDSPWYSSLTIFRQKKTGDWIDVVNSVLGEITTKYLSPSIAEHVVEDSLKSNVQSLLDKAVSLHESGSLNDAINYYNKVVEIHPDNNIAHSNLGFAYHTQGKHDKAFKFYVEAIAINPEHADTHYNLGNLLRVKGEIDAAILSYKKAIAIEPDYAKAHFNLAVSLQEQGRLNEAVDSYKEAITFCQNDVEAYNNLGIIYQEQGKLDSAVAIYQQAMKIKPDYVEAQYNLGVTLQEQRQFDLAVAAYRQAIEIKKDYVEAHYNLGVTLQEQGRVHEAIESYQQAIKIKSDYAKAYNNLGIITFEQGQLDKAIAIYQKGISIKPDYADIYNNLSLVQLLKCDFKEGLTNYSWRWKTEQYDTERYLLHKNRLWQGEPVNKKHIFVWAEQGVGESIIFSSMLIDLIKGGANIVLECNASLTQLFARSFPTITCIPHIKEMVVADIEERFDYIVPFGDLCSWLRPNLSSYPLNPFHLIADQKQKQVLRNRYQNSDKDILIGIAWYSNSAKYKNKSMLLHNLRPLFDIPGVTFVNLQYGDTKKEREELTKDGDITFLNDDSIDQMQDLDSFAAQVAAMDMVVTISNTTAHLSGALGVPTLLMLGEVPIWYWMLDREDSPWYPSLTLFRQKNNGEWDEVIDKVAKEIKIRISQIKDIAG